MGVSWESMVWGVGFQLFRAIPRVHVPLSDVTTISEEGLRSSDMLVVECDSESQLRQFGDPGSTLGLCEVWEVSRDYNTVWHPA